MAVYEGMPTTPRVLFWSGDEAVVLRVVDTTKRGIPHKALIMIASEQLKWRYPDLIKEEELDYSITEEGTFVREYPSEYVFDLTTNPENPWIIVLCNFDGSIVIDNILKETKRKLIVLQDQINTLLTENQRLREELKEAKSYILDVSK